MGYLYALEFASGKRYIGITESTPEKRFKYHKKLAPFRTDLLVYRAWRKYGEPRVLTMAMATGKYLLDLEMRAIASYGTFGPGGYNLTPGGESSPLNLPHVRAKTIAAHIGSKRSPETCARISAAKRGVPFSRPRSAETRAKLSASLMGHRHSDETKKKISMKHAGKVLTAAHRNAIAAGLARYHGAAP